MKNHIYDYINNIDVVTTPKGDKVITMNEEILTAIIVDLYEAIENQRAQDREATAEDTQRLIDALRRK